MPASFHLRPATIDDANSIVKLTQALHTYQRNPLAVQATEQLIHDNLFKHKYAEAVLACDGPQGGSGEPVGMALYVCASITFALVPPCHPLRT